MTIPAQSDVQIDNDEVRVTRWRLPAGGATGPHRHGMDYVIVPVTTSAMTIVAPDGSVASPGDLYGQTVRCLEIIKAAIAQAGLPLASVIRTRVMLTDISRWEEAARAHGEYFGDIRPASTFASVRLY